MAGTAVGGLSRVTIVAPRTRMDLALPSDVPLADLLPTLLRHAGEDLADEGAGEGGWSLHRLGQPPLDSSRTPVDLEIRDGEVLYFATRGGAAPEVVFDDVVDAVATATLDRAGAWDVPSTRRFAVAFAVSALLAGAVGVLFAGPPQLPGGIVGILAAGVLLAVATVLSRAVGDGRTAQLVALAGLAYATVGGLLLLGGDRPLLALGAPHVLIAATALVLGGAVATVAVGDAGPLFLGATGLGAALGLGAAICLGFGASPAAAAAVIATVAFGLTPALPLLAYRLARLPVPSLPTGPDDLKADDESVDGRRVLLLSDLADTFFTGLITTVSIIVLVAELVLAVDGELDSTLLCAVLAPLLLLRARPLLGRAHRLPVLIAGAVGIGLTGYAVFQQVGLAGRLGAVVGVLILAGTVSLVYGLAVAGKRISPVWGRLLDIVEIVLIVSVVPLAAWVCGLYGWIAQIRP